MEALLQNTAKAAETEPEMHKVYDEAVKEMGTEQEVHARHILVETEEEAKAVEAELKDGADFAEEAKKKSKDPGAANGGDLGWFTKDQMVPEFSEAAFKLDKGQISDPIHTQFGWHIIKVEDKRAKPTPSLRGGQEPGRKLHRAPCAVAIGRQLAQDRHDRAPGQAAGAKPDAQSRQSCKEVTVRCTGRPGPVCWPARL